MDLSNTNNKKQKMEDKEEESEVRKFVIKWSGKEFEVEVDAEVWNKIKNNGNLNQNILILCSFLTPAG